MACSVMERRQKLDIVLSNSLQLPVLQRTYPRARFLLKDLQAHVRRRDEEGLRASYEFSSKPRKAVPGDGTRRCILGV